MPQMTKALRVARSLAIMAWSSAPAGLCPRRPLGTVGHRSSEVLGVLGKGIARQRGPVRRLLYFDADGIRGGGRAVRAPQNRVLREHFVVDLGYQEVLVALVVAPHLSELDQLHRHGGKTTGMPAAESIAAR